MSVLLEAESADEVWQLAADQFRDGAGVAVQPSRAGDTRELLHVLLTVRDPRARWVVSRVPAINPAFAIAEVVWIVRGRQDAGFVNCWNPALPRYSGQYEDYPGAYGHRLRHRHGLDQLERAYQALAGTPDSRQVVLQIWDPRTDFPDASGRSAHGDIPCNVGAFPKVRQGRLEWTQVLRSNDLHRGFPHNIVQFTVLQEIMAGWLGLEVGTYNHLSDSLHVYVRDVSWVTASLPASAALNTDNLALSKPDSDVVLARVEQRLVEMTAPSLTAQALANVATRHDTPDGYENLVRVAAADVARRRGWMDLVSRIMAECTNPVLSQLWERWKARRRDRS